MKSEGASGSQSTAVRPRKWALAVLALVLCGAASALAALHVRRDHLQERLLRLEPDAAGRDAVLVRFAAQQARPLYAAHCAACHGSDMRGSRVLGAPDLTDGVWLYGDGSVYEIERTILFGIRSGAGAAHNVSEMPPFGLTGRLSQGEIRALVQYVRRLSGLPHDAQQANDGKALWGANCSDCHGFDARGNNDYGAPDLTQNVWNNGGDPQSLYNAIYFGQHHIMPAWFGVLTLEQIRALAVYIHSVSHPPRTARVP